MCVKEKEPVVGLEITHKSTVNTPSTGDVSPPFLQWAVNGDENQDDLLGPASNTII